jgi:transcriptional regulator with XRE-family HTH domain
MGNNFGKWLENQLEERGFTQSELARRARLTQSSISLVISGARQPGPDLVSAVARGLKLPPEQVYRAAGLLPPARDADPLTEEGIHILGQLEGEDKEEAIRQLRLRLEVAEKRGEYNARKRKERPATS